MIEGIAPTTSPICCRTNSSIPGTANIAAPRISPRTDYHQPMKDDLLWVYEGLTEYWGDVLTARSGLLNQEQAHEALAASGRLLRSRAGTQLAAAAGHGRFRRVLYDADSDWTNWRRSVDFYEEGEFLWLDVDTTLRRLTKDKKSMNDFCLLFYGGPGGEPALKTYTFEDVVAASTASRRMTGRLSSALGLIRSRRRRRRRRCKTADGSLPTAISQTRSESMRDAMRKKLTLMNSIGLSASDEGMIDEVFTTALRTMPASDRE